MPCGLFGRNMLPLHIVATYVLLICNNETFLMVSASGVIAGDTDITVGFEPDEDYQTEPDVEEPDEDYQTEPDVEETEDIMVKANSSNSLLIGVLLPWFGNEKIQNGVAHRGLNISIQKIQNRILPGYKIFVKSIFTRCDLTIGLKKTVTALNLKPSRSNVIYDAFIGEECSKICEPVALVLSAANVPFVSTGCISSSLSNKRSFSTFSRVLGPLPDVFRLFLLLLKHMNWNRVAIITSTERLYSNAGLELELTLGEANVVTFRHTIDYFLDDNMVIPEQLYRVLEKEARIIFFILDVIHVGKIMQSAKEEGFLAGRAFIIIDVHTDTQSPFERYRKMHSLFQGALDGVLLANFKANNGTIWNSYTEEVAGRIKHGKYYGENEENPEKTTTVTAKQIKVSTGLYHDAVMLWAIALNKTLTQQQQRNAATLDRQTVANNSRNINFEGVTGSVNINANGDRKVNYTIFVVQSKQFVPMFDFIYARPTELVPLMSTSEWDHVIWPGVQSAVPSDTPPCGWRNEHCSFLNVLTMWLSAIASFFLIILGAVGIRQVWRKMKFAMDLHMTHLRKIDWCDLEIILPSEVSSTNSNNKNKNGNKQLIAMYKSAPVSVKMIPARRSIHAEDIDIQMELKYMRDMQHYNINKFLGTCSEAPHICVLMAYCKKGSLQDVLQEKYFNLSLSWRLSFASDIAEGMAYLHNSQIFSHGRLSSTNVVVNNMWVCKVTDYGLPLFRSGDDHTLVSKDLNEISVNFFYMAPEILTMMEPPAIGTKTGDVYSFGIIMNELALIAGPYSIEMAENSPEDIVERIIDTENPPFRPSMGKNECPDFWLELMHSCWEQSPSDRPTFAKISKSLYEHKDNRNKREQEDEKALRMREEHVTYLEKVRNEKRKEKAELEKEFNRLKCVTDKVFSHLPRDVAGDMMNGKSIEPDCFDSVSIYLSDIAGFHSLLAVSTPKEIADLLNKLYGIFERTAKDFDVYKIETLGNTYMLASGPSHNKGHWQALQVAVYALTVMQEMKYFRIPHRANVPIFLRIGIHAGPCVGGVVGTRIPRYCIFGETIDIATKVQKFGIPSKIHTSAPMKKFLDENGGFQLDYRSEMYIPKRGKIMTYWLTGYSPTDYQRRSIIIRTMSATPRSSSSFFRRRSNAFSLHNNPLALQQCMRRLPEDSDTELALNVPDASDLY